MSHQHSLPYRKYARHFLFEHGANASVAADDVKWLSGGIHSEFTPGQLNKFIEAYSKERERVQEKLVQAGILMDGVPLPEIHVMTA